jgi:hypothetical protein
VLPASTVAVSVTTLPEVTVVTPLPPDVTANVVVVAADAAQARSAPPPRIVDAPSRRKAAGLMLRAANNLIGNGMILIWIAFLLNMIVQSLDDHRELSIM